MSEGEPRPVLFATSVVLLSEQNGLVAHSKFESECHWISEVSDRIPFNAWARHDSPRLFCSIVDWDLISLFSFLAHNHSVKSNT
jgi:hypothetical protein